MTKMMRADDLSSDTERRFTLAVRQGRSGLWFVTSPEVRWLLVTGHSLDEALGAVPRAIAALARPTGGMAEAANADAPVTRRRAAL